MSDVLAYEAVAEIYERTGKIGARGRKRGPVVMPYRSIGPRGKICAKSVIANSGPD